MPKLKYILLAGGLAELAIGLSNARPNAFFYLGLPVGTVLLGLALITQIMEKESALYDEQLLAAAQSRTAPAPGRPVAQKQSSQTTAYPGLTTTLSP